MLTPRLFFAGLVLLTTGGTLSSLSEFEYGSVPATANGPLVKIDPESGHTGTIELLGTWESSAFGRQILTMRPDGTGTISMTLTPFAVPIYGRKVNLDLQWTLNGKYLTQQIVGGSPERSVDKLIRKFGATREYVVVEHDANYLLVRDVTAGGDPVRWTAVDGVQ